MHDIRSVTSGNSETAETSRTVDDLFAQYLHDKQDRQKAAEQRRQREEEIKISLQNIARGVIRFASILQDTPEELPYVVDSLAQLADIQKALLQEWQAIVEKNVMDDPSYVWGHWVTTAVSLDSVPDPAQQAAPVDTPVAAPVIEPVVEPVTEPVVEPVSEVAAAPVLETVVAPVLEPVLDLVEPAPEPEPTIDPIQLNAVLDRFGKPQQRPSKQKNKVVQPTVLPETAPKPKNPALTTEHDFLLRVWKDLTMIDVPHQENTELGYRAVDMASLDGIWLEEFFNKYSVDMLAIAWQRFSELYKRDLIAVLAARCFYTHTFVAGMPGEGKRIDFLQRTLYQLAKALFVEDTYEQVKKIRKNAEDLAKLIEEKQNDFDRILIKYFGRNWKNDEKAASQNTDKQKTKKSAGETQAEDSLLDDGEQESVDSEEENSASSKRTALPASSQLLKKTKGKRAVLVGGDKREDGRKSLEQYFEFSSLVWVDPIQYNRVDAVAAQIRNGNYEVAIVVNSFIRHGMSEKIRAAAKATGCSHVAIGKGYGITRVEKAMREQWRIQD